MSKVEEAPEVKEVQETPVVEEAPAVEAVEAPVAEVETPIEEPKVEETPEQCWNCRNNSNDDAPLVEGKCDKCGFDKGALYNVALEAKK